MAPPWSSRLLSKKNSSSDSSIAVNIHAWATGKRNPKEDGGTRREKSARWRQAWAWRFRRTCRRRPPPAPSHPCDNNTSAFALALVFFSLGALLVAGIASSQLRSKATSVSSISSSSSSPSFFSRLLSLSSSNSGGGVTTTSYAPPKNWTSPPAAVRVVDGDTIVAAGIVVRLMGMDAPEDGQLCSGRRRRSRWGIRRREKERRETPSSPSSSPSPSSFFSLQWWLRMLLPSPPTSEREAQGTRRAPPRSSSSSSGPSYDCGAEATAALRGLVAGKSLQCERRATDRYGRALSRCFVDGGGFFLPSLLPPSFRDNENRSTGSDRSIDVGEWMLSQGHAVSYLGFTKRYLEAEEEAKTKRRGIWGGEFEVPKVWREKRRAEREAQAKKETKRKSKGATVATRQKTKRKATARSKSK